MRTGRRCGTVEAQREGPAQGRRWAFAGLTAVLLVGGEILMFGQSPANLPEAATKPAQAAANPAPISSTPTQNETLQAQQPAPQPAGDAAKSDNPGQLQLEADNLLRMANELMIQIDRTKKDTLSLAVVRKANEIEQLAHKMKDQ